MLLICTVVSVISFFIGELANKLFWDIRFLW
jgi:hypothetical protein